MKAKFTLLLLFAFAWQMHSQNLFQKFYKLPVTGSSIAYDIKQTADGGYIMAGMGDSTIGICMTRIDSLGALLWMRTYDWVSPFTLDMASSVIQTSDGGFLVAGITENAPSGLKSIDIMKTDANGFPMWNKAIGVNMCYADAACVQETFDGGYIICGSTCSMANGGNSNIALVKLDAAANIVWSKTYGEAIYMTGFYVIQSADSGFVVTGYSDPLSMGTYDIVLMKTDSVGTLLWNKTYSGPVSEYGYMIRQSADGGFIVAGQTTSFGAGAMDAYLIKTDSAGNTLWSKTYGGVNDEWAFTVWATPDSGCVFAGETQSFGMGNRDVFFAKADANGNLVWSKTFGDTLNESANSIIPSQNGGYVIAGSSSSFSGSPSPGIYLIKTDANGDVNCNQGNPNPVTTAVTFNVTSSLWVDTAFTPVNSNPIPLVSSGAIASTVCLPLVIEQVLIPGNSLKFYPNPSNGNFVIGSGIENGKVEIYNVLGKLIYQSEIIHPNQEIDLTAQPGGIYLVNVKTGKESFTGKIIVQN